MEAPQDAQRKLWELKHMREQVIEQIARAHGTLKQELQKMLVGIDAEIAELGRRIDES